MFTSAPDTILPDDPVMLMSMVNTMLRDRYTDGLDSLCRDLNLDRGELENRLAGAGFEYDAGTNKFW